MTTHSDEAIDRALAELPEIPAPRSVWRSVERQLEYSVARARLRRRLLAGSAGVAATLVLSLVLLVASLEGASVEREAWQQTVDLAVRQARPQAHFSNHAYSGAWSVSPVVTARPIAVSAGDETRRKAQAVPAAAGHQVLGSGRPVLTGEGADSPAALNDGDQALGKAGTTDL